MEDKQINELTVDDVKKLAERDPIIRGCMKAFDVTTPVGWESALIAALYFKCRAAEVLAEELLEYKMRYPEPLKYKTDKEDKE